MNDRRIFAAEFEHDRRQVFCCRRHDDLGHCRAAGEKDVVPRLFQQCGRFRNGAEDDRKRLAVQVLWKMSRAMTSAVAADTSEGLMTAALPAEIAATNGDNVSMTG